MQLTGDYKMSYGNWGNSHAAGGAPKAIEM
jgi:hypothetical protein